jgi:hypothetical protein
VGESFTLPEACELVTTVRVAETVEAVIVTDVVPEACQVRTTLCPAAIVFVFAEKTMLGIPGGVGEPVPAHAQRAKRTRSTVPKLTLRRPSRFIAFSPFCVRNSDALPLAGICREADENAAKNLLLLEAWDALLSHHCPAVAAAVHRSVANVVNVGEDHDRVPGFETWTEYLEAGSNNCSDLYMLENSHLGTPINVTGQTAKPGGDDRLCQGPWYLWNITDQTVC